MLFNQQLFNLFFAPFLKFASKTNTNCFYSINCKITIENFKANAIKVKNAVSFFNQANIPFKNNNYSTNNYGMNRYNHGTTKRINNSNFELKFLNFNLSNKIKSTI